MRKAIAVAMLLTASLLMPQVSQASTASRPLTAAPQVHNTDRGSADEPQMKLQPGVVAKAGTGAGIVYPGGPGHAGPVYAVKWLSDGSGGWCIDFVLHNPDSSHATPISRVPGMNREQSRRTMYIINKHVGTRSDAMAAAVAFHTWSMQNEAAFKTWFKWAKKNHHIGAAVLKLYNGLLSDSLTHGPHRVSVSATSVLAGESGKGTVMVKASNGKPDPGMRVDTVSNDNAVITSQSHKSNAQGLAKFTYKRTGLDRVKFTTTLTAPSSTRGWLSNPASGNQRLVLGGAKEKTRAVFSFQKKLKVKVKNECLENCDGQGTIVVSMCTGGSPVRVFEIGDNGVTRRVDFKAKACDDASFLFPDGPNVTTEYCLLDKLDGTCTTPRVTVGTIEVVCPEWAKAAVTPWLGCDSCSVDSVQFLAPQSSPRTYVGFYELLGQHQEVNLTNGTIKLVNLGKNVPSGTSVTLGFKVYANSDHTKLLKTVTLGSVTVSKS